MNKYTALKNKIQAEVNDFPMKWAFSTEQFEQSMSELGLTPEDTDKIYSIGGGGFIRKTDSNALAEMGKRHAKELADGMQDAQFAYEAFNAELANHEYCYTYDVTDTLEALGLTHKDIESNEVLKDALTKAVQSQIDG